MSFGRLVALGDIVVGVCVIIKSSELSQALLKVKIEDLRISLAEIGGRE